MALYYPGRRIRAHAAPDMHDRLTGDVHVGILGLICKSCEPTSMGIGYTISLGTSRMGAEISVQIVIVKAFPSGL